ncbi:MAG TPA: hypothetical protein VGL84_10325, partial [Gaiellaceae bacterium]
LPFTLVAALRAAEVLGRITAASALVISSGLVVFGQVVGLNPNDPSSTAVIAVAVLPIYACMAVGLVFGVERITKAVVSYCRLHFGVRPG